MGITSKTLFFQKKLKVQSGMSLHSVKNCPSIVYDIEGEVSQEYN